ncbi:MAG: CRTAC1 family protein [Planctomycetota bacterium]
MTIVPTVGRTAGAQWTDMADAFLQDAAAGTTGAAWGDLNGDGLLDLIWLNFNTSSRIALNDGDGTFTPWATSPLLPALDGRAIVLGDSDNDGDLDVFLSSFDQPSRVLVNDGAANLTEVATPGVVRLRARGAAWLDLDGDGLLDVFASTNAILNDVLEDKLFINLGGNAFADASPPVFGDPNMGRGIAWADFDDDGDLDLYAGAGNGCPCNWEEMPLSWETRWLNRMFRNDDGVLVDVTTPVLENPDNARGIAVGDYDNDGDLDIYIANGQIEGEIAGPNNVGPIGGFNKLLRNDGDFVFTDVTTPLLEFYGLQRSAAWVDYDNDGDLDLHVVGLTGPSRLFRNVNNGESWVSVHTATFGQVFSSGAANPWADYDQDGDLDVFVTYKNAANRLLRNDLALANHWLRLELEGTASNRSAVGARITVNAGATSQIREVMTGSGYWTQHALAQHFGLGGQTLADSVVIRWPSGTHQVLQGVAVDQQLDVLEPTAGDVDYNGQVDVTDLLQALGAWGACSPCPEDVDGNGIVDVTDLLEILANWG